MSKENAELLALPDGAQAEDAPRIRSRKQSADSVLARTRREAIALDGLMFESTQDESQHPTSSVEQLPEPGQPTSMPILEDHGTPKQGWLEQRRRSADNDDVLHNIDTIDLQQKTTTSTSTSTSPSSSTASSSSERSPESKPTYPQVLFSPAEQVDQTSIVSSAQADLTPPLSRSISRSKRQSLFLGDHISINQDGPIIESPSAHSRSNDDQEDMKEVQIETDDPSHLFWVPFHLHPEIAPNEYNKWLSKHGVDSDASDGAPSPRNTSITRRKSVLSALYNPEEDNDEPPSKPNKIAEELEDHDFLSGVFSAPLEQMGEPPLKTKTSLRRSVSLSVSPTRDHFPADAVEEDLMTAKRPGGLERGGLSLLRRSARTKIRRNSTASNDTRNDVSRLRQTISANGEYPAVSLVDPGPLPLPSAAQSASATPVASQDASRSRKESETAPLKRFVSTLRDSSKPTITTYVEPHLLEQQRKEHEEASGEKVEDEEAPSFRISAPGKLENTAAALSLVETAEQDHNEKPDKLAFSYPIPPPVKLAQNLLQEPASQPASPAKTPSPASHTPNHSKQKHGQPGSHGNISHAKKPSTWSWLWGKEKGGEKGTDTSTAGSSSSSSVSGKSNSSIASQGQSAEGPTQTAAPNESMVKKQSTLSMLFSRNGKTTSSKSQATASESTQATNLNDSYGQSVPASKPKYSNYNRLPIHIERAIYRLSHVKLANPRRPLHEQVLISNMMFWYLGVIQQQQMLQQQVEQQQQQQLIHQQQSMQQKHGRSDQSKANESKEDKEPKSKLKPKKRKSQKKKNRGSSKSAERIVKGPEYEMQQQQQHQQHQQYHVNHSPARPERPRQQGSSLPTGSGASESQRWSGGDLANGQHTDYDAESGRGTQSFSDSYDESDGDDSQPRLQQQYAQDQQGTGSQSEMLTTLSIKGVPRSREEEEEDDDVPLGHYQNLPRQAVPVS
ncbi:hypothetical protein BGX28_009709 [Mortierella sp. GBA30]|nr:hypothetical protein BGX28_009709 [Mortierella sp. GBA30]